MCLFWYLKSIDSCHDGIFECTFTIHEHSTIIINIPLLYQIHAFRLLCFSVRLEYLLSAPAQDLVHFHKALRRHNKTWGRLVAIVLLVYTLMLVFNAVFALTARTHHGTPTAAPTVAPNTTSFSEAPFSAAASLLGSTAADVAFVKNILFAALTLLILVPSIVLPPALIAGGVQELLVTMYIFADDWAASRLSAAASTTSVAAVAVAASASASGPLCAPASGSATLASASSRSPSAADDTGADSSSASSAKVVSELVVARITALMSRVSSLVGVEALTARVASISISYSIAGGLVYVLAAAALVLVPEFVSDSPFSH
jgi:hypothetical protein